MPYRVLGVQKGRKSLHLCGANAIVLQRPCSVTDEHKKPYYVCCAVCREIYGYYETKVEAEDSYNKLVEEGKHGLSYDI